MSARCFKSMRSCLQWILCPPPRPLWQTDYESSHANRCVHFLRLFKSCQAVSHLGFQHCIENGFASFEKISSKCNVFKGEVKIPPPGLPEYPNQLDYSGSACTFRVFLPNTPFQNIGVAIYSLGCWSAGGMNKNQAA